MDRLASMSVFVTAVELGSFAATAEATGHSATMVGKHIQFLEARLGARLLHRTTRRQSLTELGRAYYERCRQILADVEAADTLASDRLNTPHGTLRVTMPALMGRICIVPLLLELAPRYPSLQLDLSLDDKLVDVLAGGYDLSVRTGAVHAQSGLAARQIGSHRMIVCASAKYLDEHGVPRTLEDLRHHRAVMYDRPGWNHNWLFRDVGGNTLKVTPPHSTRLNDLAVVADAAAADAGLAWLPIWLARSQLASGTLVEVLGAQPCYAFDNFAMWPAAGRLPLRIRLALDLLASALPERLI